MRSIRLCLLTLVIAAVFGSVKHAALAQEADPSYDLWLVRSQTITADLIKDGADLDPSRRSLLLARLAQRWWRDNPEKARSWMSRAIETVEAFPNKEKPADRRERLSTARLLLKIVTPLDQKFTKRLVNVLSDYEELADSERAASAEGLIDAAFSLVDEDPQRAAQLGLVALRVGEPSSSNLTSFLFKLGKKDKRVADAFFLQVIAVARQNLGFEYLSALTYFAFPAQTQVGANIPVPPDALRTELLKLDVAFLQANPISTENKNRVCASIGSFIAPVLMEFDRLLPQQAAAVRQAINLCQSQSPLGQQRLDDALRKQPLDTVDDLLKAAADATDFKVRTVYEYRAAGRAMEMKEFDRALNILDGMSKEAREFSGITWPSRRWDWAAISALDKYNRGDLNGMRLTMDAVPADLQSFAKIAFVHRLPVNRSKEGDPTLEFLNDARKGLSRSYGSDGDNYSWYFGLLGLTVKYEPGEAASDLKDAIAALNRAEKEKEKTVLKDQSGNLDTSAIGESLPASLLEMDEYAVKEALSSINSPETRAQVRLAVLEACLQRMRKAKQSGPKAVPVASKGE